MKKVILFGAAAVFALSLASCKKDYTCTCTDGSDTETYPLGKTTKKKAKDACSTWQTYYTNLGASGVTCKI